MTRVLAIMGSGETSPTMVKLHRELLARAGGKPAVMLDTPFGFQANADELTARTVEFFRESVGAPLGVASFRSAEGDEVDEARAVAAVREAGYVFAGPGSPSYALRQWRSSPIAAALREKLRPEGRGGVVTFASAAALTLGVATVPVYEIYKVGEEPRWLDGLDLLAEAGLRAAVIPHFDNAEGGTHDTRFCYLGEDRLRRLEAALPPGAGVLGVDEHTALVLDLDAGAATVSGRGRVTVRSDGASVSYEAGTSVPIAELAAVPSGRGASGERPPAPAAPRSAAAGVAAGPSAGRSPLMDAVASCEQAFEDALAARDARGAAASVLELEATLVDWSRDPTQSDEADRGRSALRSMLVRLGDAADAGVRDPAVLVGPFVDALLEVRERARADGRYAEADAVRDHLRALGVQVRDTGGGTTWGLLS